MKQEILVWKVFNQKALDELAKARTVRVKREIIKDTLALDKYEWNHKEKKIEILLDEYMHCYNFTTKHKFNMQSISVLLGILNQVHAYACQTSFENILESSKFSRELILAHATRRPPFSIEIFTPHEAKLAEDYMTDSYFRHFYLYKYVFTPRVVMDLNFVYPNQPELEEETMPDEALSGATPSSGDAAGDIEEAMPAKSNDAEIEEMLKLDLNNQLAAMLDNFEKTLAEVKKDAMKRIDEIAPKPPSPQKSPQKTKRK